MNPPVFVYADIRSLPVFVGRLWVHEGKRREGATFEYDRPWLTNPNRFALEPALTLNPGPFHTPADKALFGALGDSAPDRWGRVLMRRAAKYEAKESGGSPHALREIDFLLRVDDEARQGALRFSQEENGPFLACGESARIPPLIELPRLLFAAEHFSSETDSYEELRLLLAPGSSLGGARPKASVRDANAELAIAKFPHKDDEFRTVLWEAVSLNLAEKAGILVPARRVENIKGKPVLLLRRFDRDGAVRIPFLSAMSMLGAKDNEVHSYLEIADALRKYGSKPHDDLRQLWRRIVFSVLISNLDDHLRNHGFLYDGTNGWRLSPAYDLNPVPSDIKPRILSTAIDYGDQSASLDNAFSVSEYFGISAVQARDIAEVVGGAVKMWRTEAVKCGLKSKEIDRMSSAFEHPDLGAAVSRKCTGNR